MQSTRPPNAFEARSLPRLWLRRCERRLLHLAPSNGAPGSALEQLVVPTFFHHKISAQLQDHGDHIANAGLNHDEWGAITLHDNSLETDTEGWNRRLYPPDARQGYFAASCDGTPAQGCPIHNANFECDAKQEPIRIPGVGGEPKDHESEPRACPAGKQIQDQSHAHQTEYWEKDEYHRPEHEQAVGDRP